MNRPDDLLLRALEEETERRPMVVVGARIGQQIQELFDSSGSSGTITVHGPGKEDVAALIRGLEMATSYSRAKGQIDWKMDKHYRIVSECGGQQAEFEILSSLLGTIDESKENRDEEALARQIWELASDEIYLLTIEE
ncbi:MAG: hypothetical protein FJY66_02445 [Calditrichaeota bacterium]|nr:hypothetical protein [Calditrichota bacterium]